MLMDEKHVISIFITNVSCDIKQSVKIMSTIMVVSSIMTEILILQLGGSGHICFWQFYT